MQNRYWLLIGALSGLAWVSIGAAMGHGVLHGESLIYFEKAQRYHIVHTLALLWLSTWAVLPLWRVVAGLWCLGVALFSGALYCMAIYGWGLNYIVPIGGVAILAGWVCLVVAIWRWKGVNDVRRS